MSSMVNPDMDDDVDVAERIAALFHRHYELQASAFGYSTRPESAVPWSQVPENNRALMISVVATLLHHDIIRPGDKA